MHSEYSETVSFSTYVDGQAACGHLVTISAEAMGANVDATSYRPFVFGAIRLSGVLQAIVFRRSVVMLGLQMMTH